MDLTLPADLTPEWLVRFDRPGPRYTSYPTAPLWSAAYTQAEADDALRAVPLPASVYVHVPFCAEQCSFCGCTMVVAGRREPGRRYLEALARQLATLPLPADRVPVERIHLGGGTPTWLHPDELLSLFALLDTRFDRLPGCEVSVEADPEVTTPGHLDALAAAGVNRLSMGVQSFDPVVLAAVNRPQSRARVEALLAGARARGMGRLNLDLMYGLPHQSLAGWQDTLDTLAALGPDRVAVFGYAHVPWLKAHQKRIPADALPGPLDRAALLLEAQRRLAARGYVPIGLDHFALPDDPLARAAAAGTLHRNFMGYTTRADLPVIGLGMSAISELPRAYFQQKARLSHWWDAVESGASVIEKGIALRPADVARRAAINAVLCRLRLDHAAFRAETGLDPRDAFPEAWPALAPLADEGLVELRPDALVVTPRGRLLARNVAMAFDAHLPPAGAPARFSRTV